MGGRVTFYILWCFQVFAHVAPLLLGTAYFIVAAKEALFLGFIFIGMFIYQQRSTNNIKSLFKDRKDFERGYWTLTPRFDELNKRYSLRKKREIPENKVRKHLYKTEMNNILTNS